jgi:outer membrane receptor protein involved in Fe transport
MTVRTFAVLIAGFALAGATVPTAADTARAGPADSLAADSAFAARIVRRFPPLEVRALIPDLLSSQTTHSVSTAWLSALPVDRLADAVALQAGVVAEADELHVRGGRTGETAVNLEGLSLSEPLRGRPIELPVMAVGGADLVTGGPEARLPSGLAGVLDVRTVNPSPRPSARLRWRTDGRLDTHFDQLSGRAGGPLGLFGLGAVAAGDVALDDTWLPNLRTLSRRDVLGLRLGWRAENRLLGFLKLAPVSAPDRLSAQVLVGRAVHEPYSPNWSLDGWTYVAADPKVPRVFSPTPQPGYLRYRAADHLDITDDRSIAALLSTAAARGDARGKLSLGWLHTRTVTSVGGSRRSTNLITPPSFGQPTGTDNFYLVWGDDPLYRESGSDSYVLRGDGELQLRKNASIKAGAGFTWEDVRSYEFETFPEGWGVGGVGPATPLDTLRTYHARAPGSFAHAQGRWLSGGMILNAGLRLEYFTAGPERSRQTLPGPVGGFWSLSPRFGIAYPVSVRDVFSVLYARLHQAPPRDALYDTRHAISNRQPLGNPALAPATVISYEAALKHVIGPTWAAQASVFYRDLYDLPGARDAVTPDGVTNLIYTNDDQAHALGFEWSLVHAAGDGGRFEASYTWMQAYGSESRPEGDPYGAVRDLRAPPVDDTPLSWDRRHSLAASGAWRPWRGGSLAWSTSVGSPLPWTPRPRRQPFTDFALVNSARLGWTESTDLAVRWSPRWTPAATLGIEVRNLFDHRGERAATVDGYPSPTVNTLYDDYGAYRTETGLSGGAYWSDLPGGTPHWVPVPDPRLLYPPRAVRASIELGW